jgi:hypothetical protein
MVHLLANSTPQQKFFRFFVPNSTMCGKTCHTTTVLPLNRLHNHRTDCGHTAEIPADVLVQVFAQHRPERTAVVLAVGY